MKKKRRKHHHHPSPPLTIPKIFRLIWRTLSKWWKL